MRRIEWPEGKSFAFTIVDDTDNATIENISSIYETLSEFNFRITKTVWPFAVDSGLRYESSDTLENKNYLKFILNLRSIGHEIGIHGARGCSSQRAVILNALSFYRECFGDFPKIHINHAQNLDNLYWGKAWIPGWKKLLRKYPDSGSGYGHVEGSEYFWGDASKSFIKYVRGYVFNMGNTLAADPYMPYYDAKMPYVNNWFSSSNGDGLERMLYLTSTENIDELEAAQGACIVYTHFGDPYYTDSHKIKSQLKENLKKLANRNGWFVPASELLDFLGQGKRKNISVFQRSRLDLRYTNDLKKRP